MTNTPPKFENDLNSPSPPIKIRLYEKKWNQKSSRRWNRPAVRGTISALSCMTTRPLGLLPIFISMYTCGLAFDVFAPAVLWNKWCYEAAVASCCGKQCLVWNCSKEQKLVQKAVNTNFFLSMLLNTVHYPIKGLARAHVKVYFPHSNGGVWAKKPASHHRFTAGINCCWDCLENEYKYIALQDGKWYE